MNDVTSFKVGDLVVRFGEVCQITRIEKREDAKGKTEDILYYRPYYLEDQVNMVTYSIAANNMTLTTIRNLMSKQELFELLQSFADMMEAEETTQRIDERDTYNLNDPHEVAFTLKRTWNEIQEKEGEISKSKRDLYNATMKILVEEIALVKDTSITSAKKLITRALNT